MLAYQVCECTRSAPCVPMVIARSTPSVRMVGLAAAGQGWMYRTLGGAERLLALALGVGAFFPSLVVKAGAALALGGFLLLERVAARKALERSVRES